MIRSHYDSGSGAIAIRGPGGEERRTIGTCVADLPENAEIRLIALGEGGPGQPPPHRDARNAALTQAYGREIKGAAGLPAFLQWLQDAPNRCGLILDLGPTINSPGHYRALMAARPGLMAPKNLGANDRASLAVLIGPVWELPPSNPLKGILPVLDIPAPDRETLRTVAAGINKLNGEAEQVIDALCGLSTETAQQACAEVISAHNGTWNVAALRTYRAQQWREAGLEIRPVASQLGGLTPLKRFINTELLPNVRDAQLGVKNILCSGQAGTGKTYWPTHLAHLLGVEPIYLSMERLKTGIVGGSHSQLRRAFSTIDAVAAQVGIPIILDELDKLATDGLDAGTSSGMYAELLAWLEYREGQSIVIATCNDASKLAAPLRRRFESQWYFDLPTTAERRQVAEIHFGRLGCAIDTAILDTTVQVTEGYSCAEIAQTLIRPVARRTGRKPTVDAIVYRAGEIRPVALARPDERELYRRAAADMQPANDQDEAIKPSHRTVYRASEN